MSSDNDSAILLLAHGAPQSIDDIEAFLKDICRGRAVSHTLIEEVKNRYRQIGGASPLLPITNSLAQRLALATHKRVYVGMRHWHPYISETTEKMAHENVHSFSAICLAPHYSAMSIGAYRAVLEQCVRASDRPWSFNFVDSWHTQSIYIDALAQLIKEQLEQIPLFSSKNLRILFSAHSLPERILTTGDPYVTQLEETCTLLRAKLGLGRETAYLCFQSAAQTGEAWLGPPIEKHMEDLAGQGVQTVIVAPIGFVMEHVEILYDIDIALQSIATRLGIQLRRTRMLNDGPEMVAILSQLSKFF